MADKIRSERTVARSIQTKATYAEEWAIIEKRMKNYMNISRRGWSNAVYVLLDEALTAFEKECENEIKE